MKYIILIIITTLISTISTVYSSSIVGTTIDAHNLVAEAVDPVVNCYDSKAASVIYAKLGQHITFDILENRLAIANLSEKLVTSIKNSDSSNLQNSSREKVVEHLQTKRDFMKDLLEVNKQSLTVFTAARNKAMQEAIAENKIFNECAYALTKDSFRAFEHVKFFYPRLAASGSAKTFEDVDTDTIELLMGDLADNNENFKKSKKTFKKISKLLEKIGSKASIKKNPYTGKDQSIDSKLRSIWACGVTSSASFAYLKWARRPKLLAKKSEDQLTIIEEIIEASTKLLGNGCEANIQYFTPTPRAAYVCNIWAKDLLFYANACPELKDPKDKSESNSISSWEDAKKNADKIESYHSSKSGQYQVGRFGQEMKTDGFKETYYSMKSVLGGYFGAAKGSISSYNREHEVTPILRVDMLKNSIDLAQTRIDNNTKLINDLDVQIKQYSSNLPTLYKAKMKLVELTNMIFILTNNFIESAYAATKSLLNYNRPKIKNCLIKYNENECASIESYSPLHITDLEHTNNEIQELMGQLGDSLQSNRSMTVESSILLKELQNKQDKMVEIERNLEGELGEMIYKDSTVFKIHNQLARMKFSKHIKKELKKRIPNIKLLKKNNYLASDKTLMTNIKRIQQKSASFVKQHKLRPRKYKKLVPSNNNFNQDSYELEQVGITSNQNKSIFEIISYRYLRKKPILLKK